MIPNLSGVVANLGTATAGTGNIGSVVPQTDPLSSSFGEMLHAGVQQATGMEANAHSAVVGLLRGEGVEVHGAMIATQQAELAFELALQVRNKAVSAYQQMMQMQF